MNIYAFETKNFKVSVDRMDDFCADLSFDETGETLEKVTNGEWDCFAVSATIEFRGEEIGCDYLGGCIYADFRDFRDNIGIKKQGTNMGSYFSDMVREVVSQARNHFKNLPKMREE